MRYVFLNGLPLNALPEKPIVLKVTPLTPEQLKEMVPKMKQIVSYVRHPATVRLLNGLGLSLEASSGLYKYEKGDVIIVVSLRRPVRGAEIENVTINDLLIHKVEVIE